MVLRKLPYTKCNANLITTQIISEREAGWEAQVKYFCTCFECINLNHIYIMLLTLALHIWSLGPYYSPPIINQAMSDNPPHILYSQRLGQGERTPSLPPW
jgi:hypothetical protein